jgi:predicted Zn-dependent peptidase/predicted Ser/Thr protein kinase
VAAEGDERDVPTVVVNGPPSGGVADVRSGDLATGAREALGQARPLGRTGELVQLGRFRIVERIGSGGMGVVYIAHDAQLDRDVAIKLLRHDIAPDLSGRERLVREAQAIAKLSHPNIVHVYEVGHDGPQVFMAMELVRGQTLRTFCKGKTWQEIVDVFIGAGEGLAAAHAESIVHRDFKPDNVIVDDRGRARVVDFGLARSPGISSSGGLEGVNTDRNDALLATPPSDHGQRALDLTGTGTVLGTPAYMAPEQLAKADPDARTDQFAFCVSLFEMLFDRRPFRGSTYTELVRSILTGLKVEADAGPLKVPRSVRAIVLRGLSRDPEQRFPSMTALLVELRKARQPRSRPLLYAFAAAATAAVVVRLSMGGTAESATATTPPSEPELHDAWADIVSATDLPELLPAAIPGDPTGVTVHRLRNGLTVYVAHRPLAPKVAVTVAVRAGSEQERDYGPGLGYLVMMSVYAGGEKLGVVDPALERPSFVTQQAFLDVLPSIEDATAREGVLLGVNAAEHAAREFVLPNDLEDAPSALGGTGLDGLRAGSGTTLSAQLPAHRVDAWLEIIAEAVQRPAFRNTFGLVQAQLALYASTTSNERAWQVLQRELAPATGLREDYETASAYMLQVPRADAKAFHATYYRPNNAAIVLVGDITPEQALPWCEKHFGAWVPAPIPTKPPLDAELSEAAVRRDIEDGGSPALFMSWPLPPTHTPQYSAIIALEDALNRHDGLGSTLRSTTADASWSVSAYRSLDVRATALPGQSLDEVEAEVMRALESIAADALPDDAWSPALARAELARLEWARSSASLAETIAWSFIDRRSWRTVAADLVEPPSRPGLVAAAKALLERSRIVVRKHPGDTWHVPVPTLPGLRVPERFGRQSEFVRAIVDAPIAPPEPRFLVAGSHYETGMRGTGRVITTAHEGPLAFASWVYPVGVDDDPFVCDAVRARMRAVRIPGVDFDSYCTNDFVWVDIVASSARFDREAAFVFDWLERGMPSESEIAEYIERALQSRASRRASAVWREPFFHAWALRGEHVIDSRMATDDELRRRGAKELPASLRRLSGHAADLLYVGPSADRMRQIVPPTSGKPAGPRTSPKTRTAARDMVFVLHDPAREDAEVRAAMPWPDLDPRTALAADIQLQTVSEGVSSGPAMLEPRFGGSVWWATAHPLALRASFACANGDVELAVGTARDLLRRRVPDDQFATQKRELEVGFRSYRALVSRVPETALLWETPGTDPRVAQWLALPSLEHEDMRNYYTSVAKAPVFVSIIANADELDWDALARFGEVVRVELSQLDTLLRDPEGSEG